MVLRRKNDSNNEDHKLQAKLLVTSMWVSDRKKHVSSVCFMTGD